MPWPHQNHVQTLVLILFSALVRLCWMGSSQGKFAGKSPHQNVARSSLIFFCPHRYHRRFLALVLPFRCLCCHFCWEKLSTQTRTYRHQHLQQVSALPHNEHLSPTARTEQRSEKRNESASELFLQTLDSMFTTCYSHICSVGIRWRKRRKVFGTFWSRLGGSRLGGCFACTLRTPWTRSPRSVLPQFLTNQWTTPAMGAEYFQALSSCKHKRITIFLLWFENGSYSKLQAMQRKVAFLACSKAPQPKKTRLGKFVFPTKWLWILQVVQLVTHCLLSCVPSLSDSSCQSDPSGRLLRWPPASEPGIQKSVSASPAIANKEEGSILDYKEEDSIKKVEATQIEDLATPSATRYRVPAVSRARFIIAPLYFYCCDHTKHGALTHRAALFWEMQNESRTRTRFRCGQAITAFECSSRTPLLWRVTQEPGQRDTLPQINRQVLHRSRWDLCLLSSDNLRLVCCQINWSGSKLNQSTSRENSPGPTRFVAVWGLSHLCCWALFMCNLTEQLRCQSDSLFFHTQAILNFLIRGVKIHKFGCTSHHVY